MTPDLTKAIEALEYKRRQALHTYASAERGREQRQREADAYRENRDKACDESTQLDRAIRLLRGEPS